MKTWRAWTDHELRRLEELRLDGLKSTAIARELGRTIPSVKMRLQEEEMRYVGVSEKWLRVLTMAHTIASAAAEMGTTKHAVKQQKRKLRRAGFAIPDAVHDADGRSAAAKKANAARWSKREGSP